MDTDEEKYLSQPQEGRFTQIDRMRGVIRYDMAKFDVQAIKDAYQIGGSVRRAEIMRQLEAKRASQPDKIEIQQLIDELKIM